MQSSDRSQDPHDPFDPGRLARLDRIRLRPGRVHGDRPGETPVRSFAQATGIEVEKYQAYSPGDDLRHLDWMALGRLDQLLTRRFVAEREIPVHVFVDASASMDRPAVDRKIETARGLAVALAWIALNNNDVVRLAALRAEAGTATAAAEESRTLRHRGRHGELRAFIAGLEPRGGTALAPGVTSYLERHRERGLAFLISDFLSPPDDWQTAVLRLVGRGIALRAIHVVGAEERTLTSMRGRFRLRDSETGRVRDVSLTDADRRHYRERFEARLGQVSSWCHSHGVGWGLAATEAGVEQILLGDLARAGMVRFR